MIDALQKRYGRQPTVYTGFGGYDATYVWAEAVKRARSLEVDAVVGLERTDHVGTIGRIVFDPVSRREDRSWVRERGVRAVAGGWEARHRLAEGDGHRQVRLAALGEPADEPLAHRRPRFGGAYQRWQEGGNRVVVWPKELRNGKFIPPPWTR